MKIKNFFFLFLISILTMQIAAIGLGIYLDRFSNNMALIKIVDSNLEKSFEVYKDEIIGNLIVGNNELVKASLDKIANNENLTYFLNVEGFNFNQYSNSCTNCRVKTFELTYAGKSYGKITLTKQIPSETNRNISFLIFAFIPLLLISIFIVIFFHRWFEKSILIPLNLIAIGLKDRDTLSLQQQILELNSVPEEVKKSLESLIKIIDDSQNARLLIEKNQIFKQVSHDIRSPLSALNMIVGTLTNIPEDSRVLVRASVNRINDIANQLLQKSVDNIPKNIFQSERLENKIPSNLKIELLPAILEMMISEKRIQFRENSSIEIEGLFENSYGLFAKIDSIEFKRVISNLINNSVEAIHSKNGLIRIHIKKDENKIKVIISDNGKGIPSDILEKIGLEEVSFGKEGMESGSGLGMIHAKKSIETFGGTLDILSKINHGTDITLSLPLCEIPSWFVPFLNTKDLKNIIALDDDLSVLEVWRQRFNFHGVDQKLHTFTSANEFLTWYKANSPDLTSSLFLMDFELLGQGTTGLNLIENLSIGHSAILVTSRYEELEIRNRCLINGVKLIPKGMAPYIPINH